MHLVPIKSSHCEYLTEDETLLQSIAPTSSQLVGPFRIQNHSDGGADVVSWGAHASGATDIGPTAFSTVDSWSVWTCNILADSLAAVAGEEQRAARRHRSPDN